MEANELIERRKAIVGEGPHALTEMARRLKTNYHTYRNWEAGRAPVPKLLEKFIDLLEYEMANKTTR